MKKVFGLSDVDCPVCAGKMQEAIAKIPGVISARIDFLVLKLTIEANEEDFPKILKAAAKEVRRVEPDCEIEEL